MNKPIPNSIASMQAEMTEWRRDLHEHPELNYEEVRTAGVVAAKLRSWSFDEVVEGLGKTGVVGILHGHDGPAAGPEKRVLLRADMDALPILEATGAPHASKTPGKMHACGHDGHTTMLLGAAKHLAETRNFSGTLVFVFQPAEEGGGGAKAMIDDGLLARWPVRAAFGMHNHPGSPVGTMGTTPGAALAYADRFKIVIRGKGGHAAMPHLADDVIVAGAQLVTAFQSIISRRRDPMNPAVISITKFSAGSAYNVLPPEAELWGTVRVLDQALAGQLIEEMRRQCEMISAAMGCTVEAELGLDAYPVTWNDPELTKFSVEVMQEVCGEANVDPDATAVLGGEDFAFFGQVVPASFIFIGNGDTAPLHHPQYDFNDEISPLGVHYWTRIAERALPRG
ncbi:M20 aminoacylase family protein [Albimonas pacifica]|uniref:Hippurate hydrolase n=1 Tax=Albimonas pacifica TaxID=1114924 RepID=A0A1I3D0F2_9RHOB|nr:M20 aminoacylase family protein [Albimonas pacifica]SFH80197.1 hippurate hydrolase [Albimonas pacifica]